MKKNSYQILKDKLKESEALSHKIRNDFKKVLLHKDSNLEALYLVSFKIEDDHENMLWFGEPAKMIEVKEGFLNGLKSQIKNG